jgi:hypothetical protein
VTTKQESPEEKTAREDLEQLREGLMTLHKTLIDSERVGYEQTFGAIGSPNDFLRLLLSDPWFAWLRPLSAFISSVDEALDAEEPVTKLVAKGLINGARDLLRPSEEGEGFGRHYFVAMQRDPDVVLAHAVVVKLAR